MEGSFRSPLSFFTKHCTTHHFRPFLVRYPSKECTTKRFAMKAKTIGKEKLRIIRI
jgi:hypothetical protein